MEDINNNFTMVSEEEMVAVNGGGWNEFGKHLQEHFLSQVV